jgi:carboxyl-terminal processing protease
MARTRRALALAALVAAGSLAGCGGTPSADCSPTATRFDVRSLVASWYLFAGAVDLAAFDPVTSTLSPAEFLDAMVASASGPDAGRHYSYLTTVSASQQFFDEGTSLGFGIGLHREGARLFVAQVFGDAMDPAEPRYPLRSPAARAGLARGDELLAIAPGAPPGPSAAGLDAPERQLAAILAAEDATPGALSAAFGSSVAGTVRDFRLRRADGVTVVDVQATTATYWLDPVPRYLTPTVLTSPGGKQVGYLMLRSFINPATDALARTFGAFKAQGITDLVIDLRYDGGGLLSVASDLLDLMGAGRADLVEFTLQYNPQHAAQLHPTYVFGAPPSAVAPTRVAFIVSGGSASASELIPFALAPYLGADVALVGAPTLGKPAGQNPFDSPGCSTVYVILTFQLANSAGPAGYWNGLPDAGWTGSSCAAADDLTHPTGDPAEASTAAALQWIDGGQAACTPIATTPPVARLAAAPAAPAGPEPTLAQRHIPNLY